MEFNMVVAFLLVSTVGITFAIPMVNNYDNMPRCLQPPVSGLCLAYFPSYAYNAAKETCEEFVYGGCQGNQNRFVTFTECMNACKGVKPETIDFKLRTESDEIVEDSKSSAEDSKSSAEDSKSSAEDSKSSAEDSKSSVEESETSKSDENSESSESTEESADPCSLDAVMGPCRAMMPRFYFNGNVCEIFTYGGCHGNANNFKSVEDCNRRCSPKPSEVVEAPSESKTETENEVVAATEAKTDKPSDA